MRMGRPRDGRRHGLRVHHLGAEIGQLAGLVVGQRGQRHGVGTRARIGAEHAVHVGPDDAVPRPRTGWRRWRRVVAAVAPEGGGAAVGAARNKPVTTTRGCGCAARQAARRAALAGQSTVTPDSSAPTISTSRIQGRPRPLRARPGARRASRRWTSRPCTRSTLRATACRAPTGRAVRRRVRRTARRARPARRRRARLATRAAVRWRSASAARWARQSGRRGGPSARAMRASVTPFMAETTVTCGLRAVEHAVAPRGGSDTASATEVPPNGQSPRVVGTDPAALAVWISGTTTDIRTLWEAPRCVSPGSPHRLAVRGRCEFAIRARPTATAVAVVEMVVPVPAPRAVTAARRCGKRAGAREHGLSGPEPARGLSSRFGHKRPRRVGGDRAPRRQLSRQRPPSTHRAAVLAPALNAVSQLLSNKQALQVAACAQQTFGQVSSAATGDGVIIAASVRFLEAPAAAGSARCPAPRAAAAAGSLQQCRSPGPRRARRPQLRSYGSSLRGGLSRTPPRGRRSRQPGAQLVRFARGGVAPARQTPPAGPAAPATTPAALLMPRCGSPVASRA